MRKFLLEKSCMGLIPSLPYPKLLEANAEYSLLLPQLFNFKKNEIIKKIKIKLQKEIQK